MREPRGQKGAPENVGLGGWSGENTLEWWRGSLGVRGPGGREVAEPPRSRLRPLSHPRPRRRISILHSLPGLSGEFARQLPGVAASLALVGSFSTEEK